MAVWSSTPTSTSNPGPPPFALTPLLPPSSEALELRSQLDRLEGLLGQLTDRQGAPSGANQPAPSSSSLSRLLNTSVVSPPNRLGEAYARLVALLPSPRELHSHLLFFHAHVHYLMPIAHMPTLLSRAATFDRSPAAAASSSRRDFRTLALLLATGGLARTAQGTMAEYAGALAGYTGGAQLGTRGGDASPAWGKVGDSNKAAMVLLDGAAEALELSSYMEHPTLDAIRVLILFWSFRRFEASTLPSLLLSQALTLARALGLNRDPARVRGISDFIVVEDQRRIWATLSMTEAGQLPGRGNSGSVTQSDVELPVNANDEDVVHDGVKGGPRDPTVVTDTTPLLVSFRVAQVAHRISSELYAPSAKPSYDRILAINQDLLELDRSLPPALAFPWAVQGGIMIPRLSAAGKEWYRFILHLNIRALYIRLHHPFLIRGCIDEQFAFNRNSVLTTARFILACHRGLAEDARALSCRYVIHEVCNAFVCLAVNIFQDPHGHEAKQDRADVDSSLAVLHHCETAEDILVNETVRAVREVLARVDSAPAAADPRAHVNGGGGMPGPLGTASRPDSSGSTSSSSARGPSAGPTGLGNRRMDEGRPPPQHGNPATSNVGGLYGNGAPPAPSPIPPPASHPTPPPPTSIRASYSSASMTSGQGSASSGGGAPQQHQKRRTQFVALNRAAPFPRPLPLPMSGEAFVDKGEGRDGQPHRAGDGDPLLDVWDSLAKMAMYAVPDRTGWRELVEGTRFANGLDIM